MLHGFEQDRFQPNAKTGLYTYGEGRVPEYTVFNFKSSYEINRSWKVAAGIENLFNRSYQPAIAWWAARDSDFVNALGARGTLMVEYKF